MIRRLNDNNIDPVMQMRKAEIIRANNFIRKEYWEEKFNYVKSILPSAEIYVYIDKNTIEGFIGINNNYIEGIFIKEINQNKGIGTALLEKVKQLKPKLILNVYEKNKKAIKFYEKNGFKIIKENTDKETNEKEYTMIWEKTKIKNYST